MKRLNRFSVLVLGLFFLLTLAGCSATSASIATPDPNAIKPSKPGGTGQALSLTGNVQNGEKVFTDHCAECHGESGKGGIINDGSKAGTVPPLNPIDASLVNKDPKVFAANLDLYIEHGSTPAGSGPSRIMMPFGDGKILQPQEISDVIAYVISLNQK